MTQGKKSRGNTSVGWTWLASLSNEECGLQEFSLSEAREPWQKAEKGLTKVTYRSGKGRLGDLYFSSANFCVASCPASTPGFSFLICSYARLASSGWLEFW